MANLIILSGRSGAGKTVALNILEDLGYYCIDNLPLDLIESLPDKLHDNYKNIAVSIDGRNLVNTSQDFQSIFEKIKHGYQNIEIFYIDANDDILFRRFSETRRKHPLTNKKINLQEALKIEKEMLIPIIDKSDLRVDTSYMNAHDLRRMIFNRVNKDNDALSILFQSFGHKNGVPTDSDFNFDVRCLPNPYWENELRDQTGLDKNVVKFLEGFDETNKMYRMIEEFFETWIPTFESENRRYLTISIGCTGGRHRSVYFAQKLFDHFKDYSGNVSVRHRDL